MKNKLQENMRRFATKNLQENKRPDYPDVDRDGDKEESMKKALKDKEAAISEDISADADNNNNGYPDDTESAQPKQPSQHSGKTIYLVKVGTDIIEKTFNINTAKGTIADHNFDLPGSMEKAKLFKATVK